MSRLKKNLFGYPESAIPNPPQKDFKLSSIVFLIVFKELIAVFLVPARMVIRIEKSETSQGANAVH
ncbi:hypothetical protein [Epilithonimonas zeae]|uniref:hypothetical protein n=1 Tax=Epilithonimonas zeae TaxID=1416779 RepID=UPI0011152B21|nr:hypothetical protein [Epilithonimonas zeae]